MAPSFSNVAPNHLAEGGRVVPVDDVDTFVVDTGGHFESPPIVLLHGSGPGVTCLANWRTTLPLLRTGRRVIMFDQLGFGRTATSGARAYGRAAWTTHALAVLDNLGVDRADIVGNSMGGAIAMSIAVADPARIRRLVLMGTMGSRMALPTGLDTVWAYTPSMENMERTIRLFAYDQSLANSDLVQLRFEASLEPAVRASWEAMFPPPRQRWVDDLALTPEELSSIDVPVLLIHGRDDRVVPLRSSSLALLDQLNDARLHVFGQCGHWTMIERSHEFARLVQDFLS